MRRAARRTAGAGPPDAASALRACRRWVGIRQCTHGPGAPDRMPIIGFDLHVSIPLLGLFTARIDDHEGGIPERARAIGRASGTTVRFRKRRETAWGMASDGTHVRLDGLRGPPVDYIGELSADGRGVSGAWKIDAFSSRANGVPVHCPGLSGLWEMVAREVDATTR